MEESTDVQQQEITPEMFEGEQETPKAESSPVKAQEPEEAKAEPEKTPETEPTEAKETEGKEETPAEETEKPFVKAEGRKEKLFTEIKDLVAQRNALRAEVEKANADVYQPATENELVDQGMNATEAKVEALRQEIEVSRYNERVAEAQLTIGHESNRVLQDFAWANPDSKQYNEEIAERASKILDASLIRDQNTGQVIGSNLSPYQIYETIDGATKISTVNGQLKGQQDTETMLANADVNSSAAPPKQKVDLLSELWAEPL